MATSEAPAFVMPTFSSVLIEPSFVSPPKISRDSSIVELLDEQPPSKTPPRLTPLASLSEDDEDEEDDDIEEGPPPLIERKEAESASEPATVDVEATVAAEDDPKAAETAADEPADIADSPVPATAATTTKGRPGRKPKVKA